MTDPLRITTAYWRAAWARAARDRRMELCLTQARMAERMDIERPIYSRLESGRHLPSWETITALATALELYESQLVFRVRLEAERLAGHHQEASSP